MHYAKTTATAIAIALAGSASASIVAPMADTYLQSDGNQVIDTGYYASAKTKVVIDFEVVATNKTGTVFGSYGSGLPYRLGLAVGAQMFTYNLGGSDKQFTRDVPPKLTRYTATLDGAAATVTVSNALVGATAAGTSNDNTNSISLAVFGRQSAVGGFNSLFTGKIYSMQIYDDGTLVRDFIPYGFGATTGLYDRVNGNVYTNALKNRTPFVIGHDDAYVRGSASEADKVFISTDFTQTPATKVEIDFTMMSCVTNSRVFGSMGGGSLSTDLHVDRDGSGKFFYCFQDGRTSGYPTSFDVDTERHFFSLSTNEVLLTSADGTVTNFVNTSLAGTRDKTAPGPMVVFGVSNRSNPNTGSLYPCDVKVYGMKIWEDGTLVRDFTPRIVNGEAGLWDNVDSEFHVKTTNSTGDVRYGGTIESDADPIPAFTVNPQSGEAPVNGTLTLSASAPGAIGYQWFFEGEMLEGATGSTLVVEWTKNTRLVRTYKCIAFFDVFGYAESTEAVVTNAPAATVIFVK